ncbi:MAG TPA: hypothetical protein VK745_23510 [Polyangiaceae bacterium]|jgi:hypothetical protein|nr:hypothetical protein [Polyangiaceae bacterium]
MALTTQLRKGQRVALLFALGVALFLLGALPSSERTARAADRVVLAVFVSKDSSLQDLKMSELRRVFTNADDSAFSGQRSVPFNHTAHSTDRVGFDQTVLRMNPDEVSRFWIDRKIRGLPGPPRAVDSLSQLLHLVARNAGGIGYARPAQVTNEVRVIRVDGKLPSDGGYPVQFTE